MSVVSTEVRRLYRSRTDRILGGVCGGLGEYLGVDSNLIRIVWVLLSFVYGAAILVYLIAWILLPEKPEVDVKPQTALPKPQPVNWAIDCWANFDRVRCLNVFKDPDSYPLS